MAPNCRSSEMADASDGHDQTVLTVSNHAIEETAIPTQIRHRISRRGLHLRAVGHVLLGQYET